MSEYRKAFLLWFTLLLVPAYLFVTHMQDAGFFDSIGLWYTICCAVAFALPAAVSWHSSVLLPFGVGVACDARLCSQRNQSCGLTPRSSGPAGSQLLRPSVGGGPPVSLIVRPRKTEHISWQIRQNVSKKRALLFR